MTNKDNIIKIFCFVDDFCQEFDPHWEKHLIAIGKSTFNEVVKYTELTLK